MKISNNNTNKENHSPILKSSKSSSSSLPFQTYFSKNEDLFKSSNKLNKFDILFSSKKVNSETSLDKITNFNSKSSKNVLLDSYFKVSEFSSKNVYHNYKEKNIAYLRDNAKSSDEWRPKTLFSSNNKNLSTSDDLIKTYKSQDAKNISYPKKNAEVLDKNKKHVMSIVFKKKSQTKYSKINSNILDINKYGLLNNFGNELRRINFKEDSENRMEHKTIKTRLVTSQDKKQMYSFFNKTKHDDNKVFENNISNYGKEKSELLNLANNCYDKTNLKFNIDTPNISNTKTTKVDANPNLTNDNNFVFMNGLEEQIKKVLMTEDYYRKIKELSKIKNFEVNNNNRFSIRKSAMNLLIDPSSVDDVKENREEIGQDHDKSDLGLFNCKKKVRKSSINIQNLGNFTQLNLNFKTSSRKSLNQELPSNRRSSSTQFVQENKLDKSDRPRFKSNLINNSEEVAKSLSIIANKKKDDIKNNPEILVMNIDHQILPDSKVEKSFREGNGRSLFFNANNKDNRKSIRSLHLKLDRVPLRKFSNKLLQTDSEPIKLIEEQEKSEINNKYVTNIPNTDGVTIVSLLCNPSIKKPQENQLNSDIPTKDSIRDVKKNSFVNVFTSTPLPSPRGSAKENPFAIKIDFNTSVEDCYDKLKLTHYEKDLISKIKLIKKFVKNQKLEAFNSEDRNYRKIYVLQDGITILKDLSFNGKFVNIPNKKYLMRHATQTERNEKLIEFLKEASKEFNVEPSYTNVFTINGRRIFDLIDIPEEDNCCYVSKHSNFRGIHLFGNIDQYKFKIKPGDSNLLKFQKLDENNFNSKKTHRNEFPFSKQDIQTQFMKFRNFKSNYNKIKQTKSQKKLKVSDLEINSSDVITLKNNQSNNKEDDYLKLLDYEDKNTQEDNINKLTVNKHIKSSKSFDEGYIDYKENIKYEYISESESRKEIAGEKIKNYQNNKFDLFLHFSKIDISHLTAQITKKKEKFLGKCRETKDIDIKKLLDKYNSLRNFDINNKSEIKTRRKITNSKNNNKLKLSTNKAAILIKKFLEHLNILRLEKDQNNNHYQIDKGKSNSNKFINKNKKCVENIYYKIDHDVEKFLPDLIAMNIPKIIGEFPAITRMELYKLFIEYKTLLKISVAMNNSMTIMKKGIDFETFFNTVPNMKLYGRGMAQDLFKDMNERKTHYLEWDEYLRGMMNLKMKKIQIDESAVSNRNKFR